MKNTITQTFPTVERISVNSVINRACSMFDTPLPRLPHLKELKRGGQDFSPMTGEKVSGFIQYFSPALPLTGETQRGNILLTAEVDAQMGKSSFIN